MLTSAAKDRLTVDFLHDKVGGEIRTFGQVNGIGDPVTAKDGDNTLVSFPVHFAVNQGIHPIHAGSVAPGVRPVCSSLECAVTQGLAETRL